jgi:hypothetical protein
MTGKSERLPQTIPTDAVFSCSAMLTLSILLVDGIMAPPPEAG